MKEKSIKVQGISCLGCAMDAEKIIGALDGISKASVKYNDDTVNIQYDPLVINKDEFLRTLLKIGFRPVKG